MNPAQLRRSDAQRHRAHGPDALTMATATPASVIGSGDQIGRIEVGYRADLAVLDRDLRVLATIRDGEFIHRSD